MPLPVLPWLRSRTNAVHQFHGRTCRLMQRLRRPGPVAEQANSRVGRFFDAISPRTASTLRGLVVQETLQHGMMLTVDALVFVLARVHHADSEQRILAGLPAVHREALAPSLLRRLQASGLTVVPATGSLVMRHGSGELRLSQAFDRHVVALVARKYELASENSSSSRRRRQSYALTGGGGGGDDDCASGGTRLQADASAMCVSMAYWNMCTLTELDVCRMRLDEFPPALTTHMLRLVRVQARECGLMRLPEAIDALAGLAELDVSDNRLTALPLAMARLVRLRVFSCARNCLTALPGALFGMPALEELRVSCNMLTCLPEAELSRLPHLRKLDSSGNRLVDSPRGLGANGTLRFLNLSNNTPKLQPDPVLRSLPQLIVTQ